MNAKRGDRFIDPLTNELYDVTELVMNGNYVILRKTNESQEILLSQEQLKKWKTGEGI